MPVHHIPESSEILGAAILIFEIIRMFPNVHSQQGNAFHFGYIHQWVVLVGGRADLQLAVFHDQPGPATSKTAYTGGIEFFFESIEAAEGSMNIICQLSGRRSTRFRSQDLPEKTVIPVSPAVVADYRADAACLLDQLFQGFTLIGGSGDRFIQIVYISLMVFTMMYLHGSRVNMRF